MSDTSIITLSFSIEELIELETALEYYNPIEDFKDVAVYRAFYRIAKALERPWVKRYKNEDDAVLAHSRLLR
jgi:hypothetical protein